MNRRRNPGAQGYLAVHRLVLSWLLLGLTVALGALVVMAVIPGGYL